MEELKVFNENNPRPKGLLNGHEEVMKYLGIKL